MDPSVIRYRDLVARAVGVGVVLLCANALMGQWMQNSRPRQLVHRAAVEQAAHPVFLGNSTMVAALSESAFAEALPGSRPLNMALGATGPAEHAVLARAVHLEPGVPMVYGVVDTQLTDPVEGWWSTLVGNRSLAYYIDPVRSAAFYAPHSAAERAMFAVVSHVPLLAERSLLWSRVERVRRRLDRIGLSPVATNQFGRARDFWQLEEAPDVFVQRCRTVTAGGVRVSDPVNDILARAAEGGHPIYFVLMPMTASHRARYYASDAWQAYFTAATAAIRRGGGNVIDASDWVPDAQFVDAMHLDGDGAVTFSRRVAMVLSAVSAGGSVR